MGGDWYVPKLYYGYKLDLQKIEDVLYASSDFNQTHPELVNREDEYIKLTSSVLDYLREKIKLPSGLDLVFFVPDWNDRYDGDLSEYSDLQLLLVREVKTPLSGRELSLYKFGRRQTLELALYSLGGKDIIDERAKFYVGFPCC
ncbi:hypothetical protein BQ9231_00300 [Cedratvirus lausannensis]|uniref:Uncharacterized protein n=2 Tax=Pithoviruses TaxID=2023203 RepID=A0A285PWZ4_9VIRU|nr:hypothetical protein Cbor_325 [Cedratvirus borely]WIL03601.1 hypothetical protein Cplu_325 [Cedratvirus plubellavi]SOB74183.1 hypothetical protein BQ9231_00300 [Cedratvirus lausannensis]SPN79482.1 Hypothetical protein ZAZAV_334 [Cedratvirus Zaza IHUMI]